MLPPMSDKPMQWGAEALWEQLSPWLPGLSVEVVASMGSTNTALLDRARGVPRRVVESPDFSQHAGVTVRRSVESAAFGRRAVDLQPCLLVAERQTHGRGRQGRSWHAEPGASLTFSLALPLARDDWSGLSLAVGVALADALDPAPDGAASTAVNITGSATAAVNITGAASTTALAEAPLARWPRIGLKWPNDLWLLNEPGDRADSPGRKLGGVLIETLSSGPQRLAVIGIGLNVAPVQADPLRSGVACLQEIEPTLTVPEALARVALPLVMALREFNAEGFAAFTGRFARRDLLLGRPISTVITRGAAAAGDADGGTNARADAGTNAAAIAAAVGSSVTDAAGNGNGGIGPFIGSGDGVADDGALLLRTPLGVQRVTSGEVSVNPLPLPGLGLDSGSGSGSIAVSPPVAEPSPADRPEASHSAPSKGVGQ